MANFIEFPKADEIKTRLTEGSGGKLSSGRIEAVVQALSEQVVTPAAALLKTQRALDKSADGGKSSDDIALELTVTSLAAGPEHATDLREAYLSRQELPEESPSASDVPAIGLDR